MRHANTGQFGFSPQHSAGQTTTAGVDGDRLGTLKRAINAIEQRLETTQPVGQPMGQPAGFPHGAPQQGAQIGARAAGNSELSILQEQINRLSSQVTAPPRAAGNNDAIAAQISRRQQLLNQGMAAQSAAGRAPVNNNQPQRNAPKDMDVINKQLASLRNELAGIRKQVATPVAVQQSVSQDEINQIAKAIADLQQAPQFDEKSFNRLNMELNNLRKGMQQDVGGLVRHEIAQGIAGISSSNYEAELQDIATQINSLSQNFQNVGDVVRREVSQGVAGMSSSGHEAELQDLASQIEALSQNIDAATLHTANTVTPRVDNLSAQLDSLRVSVEDLPQSLAISRLDAQLAELSQKIDNIGPGEPTEPVISSAAVDSIESRLDEIARALVAVSNSTTKIPEPDLSGLDRVEARLAELGREIDLVLVRDNSADLQQIATRIDGLTDRLGSFEQYIQSGELGGAPALYEAPDVGAVEKQLGALEIQLTEMIARVEDTAAQFQTNQLEEQIQQLAVRMEETANANSTAAQMASLESQISQVLEQMNISTPGDVVDFSPVEARLGQIEDHLVNNQTFTIEAAQSAAQQAVSMMGAQSEPGQMLDSLSQDLRSLQMAAESGNEQNAQTVANVENTLLHIVDRLESIESSLGEGMEPVRQAHVLVEPSPEPHAESYPEPHSETVSEPQADSMSVPMPELQPELAQTPAPSPAPEPAFENNSAEQSVDETIFLSDSSAESAQADDHMGVVQRAAMEAGYADPYNEMPQTPEHAVEAPSMDPTEHLEKSYNDASENHDILEPGSAAPTFGSAGPELGAGYQSQAPGQVMTPAPEFSHDQPVPPVVNMGNEQGQRPDAVAAARRALQATTAEMHAAREEALSAPKPTNGLAGKLEAGKAAFDTAKLRKPLMMGTAALLLALVAYKGWSMFTGNEAQSIAQVETTIENTDTSESVKLSQLDGEPDAKVAENGDTEVAVNQNDESAMVVKAKQEQPPEAIPTEPREIGETMDSTTVAQVEAAPKDTNVVMATELVSEAPAKTDDSVETPAAAPSEFTVPTSAGSAALVAAANSGDSKALFQVGMRYSEGKEVKRNMTAAAKWFGASADKGFAPAQYSIGSLYEKGIGVERNFSSAASWYEKAAAQGNARAMHNLAVIYATEKLAGVETDLGRAVTWFQKAAEYGIKDSQFNLGVLYGQGAGVPQNLVKSYKWFALAAKTGDTDAAAKRDEVANAMDPDDLDNARGMVNTWAPNDVIEKSNRVAVPKAWRGRGTPERNTTASIGGNSAVKLVQAALNQRGFTVGTPDGVMGPKTTRAIKEFQRNAELKVTGKVDKSLLKALGVRA